MQQQSLFGGFAFNMTPLAHSAPGCKPLLKSFKSLHVAGVIVYITSPSVPDSSTLSFSD